jgi:hypothetical protein
MLACHRGDGKSSLAKLTLPSQFSALSSPALALHSPFSNVYTCIIGQNPLSVMSESESTIPLALSIIVTIALGLCFDAVLTGMCSGINVIGMLTPRNGIQETEHKR